MRNSHGVLPACVMCKIVWTIRKLEGSDETSALFVDVGYRHYTDRSLSNEQQSWSCTSKPSFGERIFLVCWSFGCDCNRATGHAPAGFECAERSEPTSSFCRGVRRLSSIWNCFPDATHRCSKTDINHVVRSNTGRAGTFPFWIVRFSTRAYIVTNGVGNDRHVCWSLVDDFMSGTRSSEINDRDREV